MEIDKQEMKEIIADPLDDLEIKEQDNNIKIISYNELANYETIEDLLPKKRDYLILLYQTETENAGHWVSLVRDDKKIFYFDSLGGDIDDPFNWDNKNPIMKEKYLTKLLENAEDDGFEVYVNLIKYQKNEFLINTCGRHCICFIEMNKNFNYNLDDYYNFMKTIKKDIKKSYDEIVATLVNDIK